MPKVWHDPYPGHGSTVCNPTESRRWWVMRDKPRSVPTALFTCPMAAHADVVSDKPGKCAKCEMDLVPTSTVAHGKKAEENWRQQHPEGSGSGTGMPKDHQH